ncbi:hypothetical protein WA026_008352 [Henosepilachna vigintioctopunctata]|uniref:Uncharacterized protein n=1 Tax=Henosepilachna vigintioctopunctata TaxID=420089 RepID=A0AAW1UB14_9CUCU
MSAEMWLAKRITKNHFPNILNQVNSFASHSSIPHQNHQPQNQPIASVQIPRVYLKLTATVQKTRNAIGMNYRTLACVDFMHPHSNNGQPQLKERNRERRILRSDFKE